MQTVSSTYHRFTASPLVCGGRKMHAVIGRCFFSLHQTLTTASPLVARAYTPTPLYAVTGKNVLRFESNFGYAPSADQMED